MGKGRAWARALKSKVTPTGRWAPGPNARARCMGNVLSKMGSPGKGQKAKVRENFLTASGQCKIKGK